MRRWAVAAFAAVVVAGLVALVAVGASDRRDLAFTLGVAPGLVAADLPPGAEGCQRPVAVAEPFDGVRVQVGTYERPGPPLEVEVAALDGGATLATGRLEGGYPDVSQPTVALDRTVPDGRRVEVCVRNAGGRKLALYGGAELAKRESGVTVDGQPVATDLTLVFTREPRSVLSQVPTMLDRAALFRPGWVGAWTFWLLGALLVVGAPALLARALWLGGAVERDERDSP